MQLRLAGPWLLTGTAALLGSLCWNWSFRFAAEAPAAADAPLQPVHLFSPRFSCGGGPFSNTMASLVSFPCDVEQIHDCCVKHDRCYDSRLEQSECDHGFCACLALLPYNGLFCDLAAHKGLCLATHVFGHMFYEAEAENGTAP